MPGNAETNIISGSGPDMLVGYPNAQGGLQPRGKLSVSLVPLDFAKLKAFFRDESNNEVHVCTTLQALRWRLTRVSASMRRSTLTSFVHYDLLEIETAEVPTKRVFDILFFSQSVKVKEYVIAFLNSLANEYQGRSYLLRYENIVALLIETLYNEGGEDSYLR